MSDQLNASAALSPG